MNRSLARDCMAFAMRSLALACLATAAVMGAGALAADKRPLVVATTGMIADAARNIGGDLVEVKSLMKSGVDPHAYRQTRSDIAALAGADLVLWNGLYLEAQMEDLLLRLSAKKTVVAVAEQVPESLLLSHELYSQKYDPHVWMDPVLWKKVVSNISEAMMSAFPEGRERMRANTELYMSEIDRLAAYSADVLSTVPADKKVLLTAHDAFNYFGVAYGFEVVGIQGISTESEPGLHRIGELIDLIVDRRIRAVFVESSVSERSMRALVEGARARGHHVEVAGELFSDAMGEEGTYEGSYIGMIDHNATLIAEALGGRVPAKGMLGRLSGYGELTWNRQ